MMQGERIRSKECAGIRVRIHGAVTGAARLDAERSGGAQEHGHHASPDTRIARKLTRVEALEGTRPTGAGGQRRGRSLRLGASARAAPKGREHLRPKELVPTTFLFCRLSEDFCRYCYTLGGHWGVGSLLPAAWEPYTPRYINPKTRDVIKSQSSNYRDTLTAGEIVQR